VELADGEHWPASDQLLQPAAMRHDDDDDDDDDGGAMVLLSGVILVVLAGCSVVVVAVVVSVVLCWRCSESVMIRCIRALSDLSDAISLYTNCI